MTSEEWVRQIIESPRDTFLRGAFADWLEERGDPRAMTARINSWDCMANIPLETGSEVGEEGLSESEAGLYAVVRCSMQAWLKSGSKIVQEQPIEQVVIVDRMPMAYYGEGHLPWSWEILARRNGEAWRLPYEMKPPGRTDQEYFFPSKLKALDWLSVRCIQHARMKADLALASSARGTIIWPFLTDSCQAESNRVS